jgi:hypothetical protein
MKKHIWCHTHAQYLSTSTCTCVGCTQAAQQSARLLYNNHQGSNASSKAINVYYKYLARWAVPSAADAGSAKLENFGPSQSLAHHSKLAHEHDQ